MTLHTYFQVLLLPQEHQKVPFVFTGLYYWTHHSTNSLWIQIVCLTFLQVQWQTALCWAAATHLLIKMRLTEQIILLGGEVYIISDTRSIGNNTFTPAGVCWVAFCEIRYGNSFRCETFIYYSLLPHILAELSGKRSLPQCSCFCTIVIQ